MDGLTTNGILIMKPNKVDAAKGWRETSVGGGTYNLRESRSAQVPGSKVKL